MKKKGIAVLIFAMALIIFQLLTIDSARAAPQLDVTAPDYTLNPYLYFGSSYYVMWNIKYDTSNILSKFYIGFTNNTVAGGGSLTGVSVSRTAACGSSTGTSCSYSVPFPSQQVKFGTSTAGYAVVVGYNSANAEVVRGYSQKFSVCYDSDGGTARFVLGTCTPPSGAPLTEKCTGSSVIEAYCNSNNDCSTISLPCDGGTPDFNMTCSGGKCANCLTGFTFNLGTDITKGCSPKCTAVSPNTQTITSGSVPTISLTCPLTNDLSGTKICDYQGCSSSDSSMCAGDTALSSISSKSGITFLVPTAANTYAYYLCPANIRFTVTVTAASTCSGSNSWLSRFSSSSCTPSGGSKILSSCTNNNKNITMPYCAADGSCKYAYFICNDTISTGVYRNATCVPDSVNGARCNCLSGYTAVYDVSGHMIGCAPPAAAPTCSGSDSALLTRFSSSSCTNSSGTFYSYCSGTVAYMRGCNVASGVCVVTPAYDCAPYNMTCGGSPGGYCNACKSGYTWVVDAAHPSSGCKPSSCTNYPGCDSSHPTNQTCTSETTYQSCMHRASDDCYVWFGQSCPTNTKYCLQSNTQLNIPNHPKYIYIQCVECLSDANCISPQLCNTTGAHNCYTPPSGQFCSDGTAYGACSVTKPQKCVSGNFVNDCVTCNCPSTGATVCNSTGALNCYTPSSTTDNIALFDFNPSDPMSKCLQWADGHWNGTSVPVCKKMILGIKGDFSQCVDYDCVYKIKEDDDPELILTGGADSPNIVCLYNGSAYLFYELPPQDSHKFTVEVWKDNQKIFSAVLNVNEDPTKTCCEVGEYCGNLGSTSDNACCSHNCCDTGYVCLAAGGCTNECNSLGDTECRASDNKVRTCGNYDTDSCLEWSDYTAPCPSDKPLCNETTKTCYNPQAGCTDECSPSGKTECLTTTTYKNCSNYDTDSCLEWSTAKNCPSDKLNCNTATGQCEAPVYTCTQTAGQTCEVGTSCPAGKQSATGNCPTGQTCCKTETYTCTTNGGTCKATCLATEDTITGTCPTATDKCCKTKDTCNSAISLSDCTTSCNCYPAGCTCPAGCVRTGNIENASNCGGAGTCSSPILLGDCTTLCNCNPAGCTCPAGCVNPTAAFGSNCGGVAPSCNSRLALPNCTAICNCNPAGCTCPLSGCEKSGQNIPYNQNCAGDKCFTRWDWNHENSECCIEESQCLVSADGDLSNNGNVSAYFTDNKPKCINSGQFILDHYCNNGNWTTRTALIAGELLNFTYADSGRSSDFTLFCDDYTYALNYYEYLPVINYLSQKCYINNIEIPCLNDICVLRYKEGQSYKVIAATALNWNISNSSPYLWSVTNNFSFLNSIDKADSYCSGVSGSDYAACNGNSDVWYNPAINAVVFSNSGFALKQNLVQALLNFLRNPFQALLNWLANKGVEKPVSNFDKLYIASVAGKKVSAFTSKYNTSSNLFMHFQSFSTNLCSEAEKFVPGSCPKATKCDQIINSTVTQGQTNKLFDSWAEMTAQLRINASFSANHCNDCIQNYGEIGIDCGGNDCPACVCSDFDSDRDGYLTDAYSGIGSCLYGDCNDNDASIHPGALEVCDGIDNNCNGIIDEVCPTTLTMWVIKPEANELVQSGAASYEIKWNLSSPMLASTFDLQFSVNNGYNNLAINIDKASFCAGNTCTYSWSPVTSSKSSQAKIRITARNSTGGISATAESGIFTLGPIPNITLVITKPKAGDILNIGAGNPINWIAAGLDVGQIESYSLHYSTQNNIEQSGDWSVIGYAQKGSSGYNWNIPTIFTAGQYYIMVKGLAADSSMLVYNITELLSTNRWCSYYVGTCSVNPYAYGGGYVCSRTQYNIMIPLAQQCPSDSGCTNGSCVESASCELTAPSDDESLVAGSPYTINWSGSLVGSALRILFYNGSEWSFVAWNLPLSQTSYSWTVPNVVCSNCSLRVGTYTPDPAGSQYGVWTVLSNGRPLYDNNTFSIGSQSSCSDSDGGKNYYVKGTVTYNGQTYTDSCEYCTGACPPEGPCPPVTCGAVKEYYCENGVMKQETHVCGSGYTCQDGACKSVSTCTLSASISGSSSGVINQIYRYDITLSGGSSPYTYAWSADGMNDAGPNSGSGYYEWTTSGTKSVVVTVTDSKGCSITVTRSVEITTPTCPSNSCNPAENGPNKGCCLANGWYNPQNKDGNANGPFDCQHCTKGYCETPACGDECGGTTGVSCCNDNEYCHTEKSPEGICTIGYCEDSSCTDCKPTPCTKSGGTWKTDFSDSCADNCERYSIPRPNCAQVITQGCDCGTSKCWNATANACVNNPDGTTCKHSCSWTTGSCSGSSCVTTAHHSLISCDLDCPTDDINCPDNCVITPSCFPAGTIISMADGSKKNIEDVKVGDLVLGYDTESKTQTSVQVLEVESPIRYHLYTLYFEDGTTLKTISEHPIYVVDKGWSSISPETTLLTDNLIVKKLEVGDSVLKADNVSVKLVKMVYEEIPEGIRTYNLKKVSAFNDYFADGVLVHNKGSQPSTPCANGDPCCVIVNGLPEYVC